jgi:hypothetical protein
MTMILYKTPHRSRKSITHKHKNKYYRLNIRTELTENSVEWALNNAKPREGEWVINTVEL